MHGEESRTPVRADSSKLRFKEQLADDAVPRGDCTIAANGTLRISPEEDTGGDPYNHTGSFRKNIR